MDNLKAFLSDNQKIENQKFVVSERFKDENNKPIQWEIKAITAEEDEQIRQMCTKKINTKSGIPIEQLDTNKYMCELAATCTVYPNLLDTQLQDSYGVKGEGNLLKKMLIAGEYTNYVSEIQKINGFNISMNELVEEAKN